MKRKPRAYPKEKRKEQILMQFAIWHEKGDTEPKTMYRIARALDIVPDQRIHEMLQELVDEGFLSVEMRDQSGRFTTKFYSAFETEALHRQKYFRRIAVKVRGVAAGQLEMAL